MITVNWEYCFISWFGAAILYFSLKNENKAVWKFVSFINPAWEGKPLANSIDILIFIFFGGLVGVILTQPSNPLQSFAGGVGWTTLLSTNVTKNNNSSNQVGGEVKKQQQYEGELEKRISDLIKELERKLINNKDMQEKDRQEILEQQEKYKGIMDLAKNKDNYSEEDSTKIKFTEMQKRYMTERKKLDFLSNIAQVFTIVSVVLSAVSILPYFNIKLPDKVIIFLFAVAALLSIIGIFIRSFLSHYTKSSLKNMTT